MSLRLRIALAITGLLLICLSLAALAYTQWPIKKTSEQFQLLPTLFAPPESSFTDSRFV